MNVSILYPGDELLDLEGAAVCVPGFPSGKVNVRAFDCSGGKPTLRLSSEADGLATHYGLAFRSCSVLSNAGQAFLPPGGWFAQNGAVNINGGQGLVVSMPNRWGLNSYGGPVEECGRLRYIDGCSRSFLAPPAKMGDPFLELIHCPPETQQEFHAFQHIRVGVVFRGSGRLLIGGAGEFGGEHRDLTPGLAFVIPPTLEHSLHTAGERLDVVVWSPESEWGPTDTTSLADLGRSQVVTGLGLEARE